ncbi:hypothetical protein CHUAL_007948 [Chamberlinius hualienensis]
MKVPNRIHKAEAEEPKSKVMRTDPLASHLEFKRHQRETRNKVYTDQKQSETVDLSTEDDEKSDEQSTEDEEFTEDEELANNTKLNECSSEQIRLSAEMNYVKSIINVVEIPSKKKKKKKSSKKKKSKKAVVNIEENGKEMNPLEEPGIRLSQNMIEFANISSIFVKDIQKLILKVVLGEKFSHLFEWCELENSSAIKNVVVVYVKNLSYETFKEKFKPRSKAVVVDCHLPSVYGSCFLNELCWTQIATSDQQDFKNDKLWMHEGFTKGTIINRMPALDMIDEKVKVKKELDTMKVENVRKNRQSIFNGIEVLSGNDRTKASLKLLTSVEESQLEKCTKLSLLLNSKQLMVDAYPEAGKTTALGICVPTKDKYLPVTKNSPMFGLDCEMCLTERNIYELTSISIVDENHKTIYNELVLPSVPIKDRLTDYRGITKQLLVKMTKRLKDVQRDIRELLPGDAILVGHSIFSDMAVLNMSHPYIIDTGVIYNLSGIERRKTGLKDLTAIFLNVHILNHYYDILDGDPTSFAVQFRDKIESAAPTSKMADEEDVKDNLSKLKSTFCVNIFKMLEYYDKKVLVVNGEQEHSKVFDVFDGTSSNLYKYKFSSNYHAIQTLRSSSSKFDVSLISLPVDEQTFDIKVFDSWVTHIYNSCAQNGMMIVVGEDEDADKGICLVEIKTPGNCKSSLKSKAKPQL